MIAIIIEKMVTPNFNYNYTIQCSFYSTESVTYMELSRSAPSNIFLNFGKSSSAWSVDIWLPISSWAKEFP